MVLLIPFSEKNPALKSKYMTKILFLIHDLSQGGAEKVLVNLVNNMDPTKFDITVTALFGGGVNEQFLKPHIHFRAIYPKAFPGNSHVMKLLSPKQLHKMYVKEHYDIEVAYMEGPASRIISGCTDPATKLVSWIHVQQTNIKKLSASFRSETEARACYSHFDQIICVSEFVKQDFCDILDFDGPCRVLYNTVESDKVLTLSHEEAPKLADDGAFRLIAVGSLKASKGYNRLLRCFRRLQDGNRPIHLYILGIGPQQQELENLCAELDIADAVTFLGYDTNPYKYVAKCDLFVCASFAEGFSTAATESLIVGTPVCTVEVSGMKEMLGEHNEWGVVTENSEEGLYENIKSLLDDPDKLAHYKRQAALRGTFFSTENTVRAVETMLTDLLEN